MVLAVWIGYLDLFGFTGLSDSRLWEPERLRFDLERSRSRRGSRRRRFG